MFGIRRGRKAAKGQQSLESAATLTLGSFSHGALEDIGGLEVQQRFWDVPVRAPPRAIFCHRLSYEKLRTTKFGTCRVPYHETLVTASGNDLAQGQVALVDPT